MSDSANLATERPTFVTHLECSMTGERYEPDRLHGLSTAGFPLLVRYDLEAASRVLDRDALSQRAGDSGAIASSFRYATSTTSCRWVK